MARMLVPPPTPKKTRITKLKDPLAIHLAILQFQDPLGTIATNCIKPPSFLPNNSTSTWP